MLFFFFYKRPYFSYNMSVIIIITKSLYFWTALINIFTNILSNNTYVGFVYIWLLGIPVICITFLLTLKTILKPKSNLFYNVNKLNSPDIVITFVRYVIYLINNKDEKRESNLLIKGFVRNHEDTCIISDCPIKIIKNNINQSYNDFSQYNQMIITQLMLYINRLYILGMTKFPNSINLKIAYSMFMYWNLKHKAKVKQELENIENYFLSFSEQFIIFRYKKLITEDIDSGTYNNKVSNHNIDLSNSIAFESHYRQCQQDIYSVARLFLEFWSLLLTNTSNPDIQKLNILTIKVNDTLKNINLHWKRMQYYKPNDLKAVKLYSSLFIEVLNNKEKGREILALGKEIHEKNENEENLIEFDEDFSNGNCGILCSTENDNYGTIIRASCNACKIFNYLSEDLINGRLIDDLFLEIYQGTISEYIQNIVENHDENLNKNEIFLLGKNKFKNIIPINLKIVETSKTINDKSHVKLDIRVDDNFNADIKEYIKNCYIVINNNLQILFHSESLSELINLIYGNKFNSNDFDNISQLIPEFCKNYDKTEIINGSKYI